MARREKLEFQGFDGSTLAARLDLPAGPMRATALFAHCFTCGKDIAAAKRIAERLSAAGVAVLRFDFTGLGHSDGEFANTTFTSNVADLKLAAVALAERLAPPELLVGHSLGGSAVLVAAGELPSVKAVATIGAPADIGHVLHHLGHSLDTIREEGSAEVLLGGRPIRIGQGFIDDVTSAKLEDYVGSLKRALLVLHAPHDEIVGIDNAATIFAAAKHPKSFISLDDADHLLSGGADADYAATVIAAWAERYLAAAPTETEAPPEGVVRVAEADAQGFLQTVRSGSHTLVADEPKSHGGTDLGLTPYQLVSAGLGTCTSMTIRMYARRKKLPLTHVEVDVSHDRIHAEDCADCETKEGRIDRFSRVIKLEGDLDGPTRQRLMEIADRCPVHRTLEGEIVIETEEG